MTSPVAAAPADATSSSPQAQRRPPLALLATLAIVAAVLYWANAWVSDDAFITFRSVEQLAAGHGPRWNPHERVQAFTHPLWFLLLAAARAVTPHLFHAALVLGFALTLGTLAIAFRAGGSPARGALAVLLLVGSKSFVDFSSGGLENPLSGMLLALLAASIVAPRREEPSDRPATGFFLIAGALLLCRLDFALLVVPVVLDRFVGRTRSGGWRAALRESASGFAPLLAWELFAVVYYGSPLPNTFYAKLASGIDSALLWRQGFDYLGVFARWDPLGLTAVVMGIGLLAGRRSGRPLALGALLYATYVLRIGGDFMAGRFFQPLVVVGALATAALAPAFTTRALLVLAIAVPAFHPRSPARFALDLLRNAPAASADGGAGIADEKLYWFDRLSWLRGAEPPRGAPAGAATPAQVAYEIGVRGYTAPLDQILVDEMGLADPLLARLPVTGKWRIGHFRRATPGGYLDSLASGENRLVDPVLRPLYDRIVTVTRGPLFGAGRWRAMAALLLHPPDLRGVPLARYFVVVAELETALREPPPAVAVGGQVTATTVAGSDLRISGRLPLGVLERGIRLTVLVPERPLYVLTDPPSADDDGQARFSLTLRMAGADAASRSLRSCVLASSDATPTRLLGGQAATCLQLVGAPAAP